MFEKTGPMTNCPNGPVGARTGFPASPGKFTPPPPSASRPRPNVSGLSSSSLDTTPRLGTRGNPLSLRVRPDTDPPWSGAGRLDVTEMSG
ncbi:hypothetical protein ETAA1_57180 [Urbifossiella limnaea]|uniref:Uncharacterized protein n=1 Tax=Urbifossiella limnaea TaxID=2528023 RepID=A0A517Y1T2_9BACT|nr:hypothetical protein ETAA1_57180 [Urbifossiella limnaea]